MRVAQQWHSRKHNELITLCKLAHSGSTHELSASCPSTRTDCLLDMARIWRVIQVAKPVTQFKPAFGAAQEKGVTQTTNRQARRTDEELWAEEGIEQLAGKAWTAMEEEQQSRTMQEINARVQAALRKNKVSFSEPQILFTA